MTRCQKIKRATSTQADGRKRRSRPLRPCSEIDPVLSPAKSSYRCYHCCRHPVQISVKIQWCGGNFINSDNVNQNTDTIQSPQFFSHSSILPLPLSKTGSFVVSAYKELFAFKAFLEDCWIKKIIQSKLIQILDRNWENFYLTPFPNYWWSKLPTLSIQEEAQPWEKYDFKNQRIKKIMQCHLISKVVIIFDPGSLAFNNVGPHLFWDR